MSKSLKKITKTHLPLAWAQFCCKKCGGQLGGKPI